MKRSEIVLKFLKKNIGRWFTPPELRKELSLEKYGRLYYALSIMFSNRLIRKRPCRRFQVRTKRHQVIYEYAAYND